MGDDCEMPFRSAPVQWAEVAFSSGTRNVADYRVFLALRYNSRSPRTLCVRPFDSDDRAHKEILGRREWVAISRDEYLNILWNCCRAVEYNAPKLRTAAPQLRQAVLWPN